jgi:hypothetical protein
VNKLETVAKLKGYRNTSVIHSSNPFAAVALMGQMNGRAQEAGSYFRLRLSESETDVSQANVDHHSAEVTVDFKRDWENYIKDHAQSVKVKFENSKSFIDKTMRHLNTVRRLPTPRQRTVHESRELVIPDKYRENYLALKEVIQSGVDLRPYLARNLQAFDKVLKPDKLLNAWDIHHLHFRSSSSGHILLCKIIDDAVFMIRASDHTGDSRPLWVDTELLRVVHDNWPEQLADRRIAIKSSTPPAADRVFVRANNGNFHRHHAGRYRIRQSAHGFWRMH